MLARHNRRCVSAYSFDRVHAAVNLVQSLPINVKIAQRIVMKSPQKPPSRTLLLILLHSGFGA